MSSIHDSLSVHDPIWQATVDEIASGLAKDLPFVRSLKHGWIYMREHSSESVRLCYGYVRYARDEATKRESFVVFTDRQDEGSDQQRYLAGFQFGDDDTVHPILTAALVDFGD